MTSSEEAQGNDALAAAMDQASYGSIPAAESFYKLFLSTTVYVPARQQPHPLSDAPQYPNDFVTVLGVQDKERVVTPVFSHQGFITAWSGLDLAAKQMTGGELLKILPEGWWLVMNPGQPVEKELSPWELEQLREGPAGIPAVLEELESDREVLSLRALREEEYAALKNALRERAARLQGVQRVYLALEESAHEGGGLESRLLIGAQLDTAINADSALRQQIRQALRDAAGPHLIGDAIPLKVFVGKSGETGMLGIFQQIPPLYEGTPAAARPWWRRWL